MRVRSEGIQPVDLSVCFPRGPKVPHVWVGASLAKEELAAGLFITSELWHWPSIARGSLMQTTIVPLAPLGYSQLLLSICRVASLVLHCNIDVSCNEYSM